jgi:hypothetical protein
MQCRLRSIAVRSVECEMARGDIGTEAERASTGAIIPRWRTAPDRRKPDQRRSMRTLCCLNFGTPRGLAAHSAEPFRPTLTFASDSVGLSGLTDVLL